MKKHLLTVLVAALSASVNVNGQGMAVNTTGASANASSMLDVNATTKGMLIPRLTTAQMNAISSPATGLMVYNTTANAFYYYDGSAWGAVGGTAVASVSGTSNRVTSTGGLNPVIDISSTFEGALGKVANPLSQFASTTSAQLAGVISNETGTGNVVFSSSPALTTPNLGTPSAVTLTNATGLPLSTGVTGNLSVNNLNSGTGASSSTFWCGNGTWAAPSSGVAAYTYATITAGSTYTIPSASVLNYILDFQGTAGGTGTIIELLPASSYAAGTVVYINCTGYITTAPTAQITSTAVGTQTYSAFNNNNTNISTGNYTVAAGIASIRLMTDGVSKWWKLN